ncbi:MAG TPA: serine hydrolase domain-containing protein [Gemmatimonadaceae bacterium]|nr:serine hydrolase domain-containing protein [Gemmatimonadaceae bacterium]
MLLMACVRSSPAVVAAEGPTPTVAPSPTVVYAPSPASMNAVLRDSVRAVLDRAEADSAFPGAFAVVGNRDTVLTEMGVGHLDWAPSPEPDAHTLWDLASLTKVIGLTTAMMQLVEQGRISLDAPLQRYIPEWTGPNKEKVTVRHLLTHTSGLPADRPYDRMTHDADSIAKLMFATPLDTLPGVRMVYSDIGAYMLGRLVERVTGQPLDRYLADHVFQPLRMTETMYNPPASLLARIAPTEFDSTRGGKLHGKVHDERAYYLGGVSAHAGLFSSGHDLARFARMYLNGGALQGTRIVRPETITLFTTRQLQDRALGWQKPNGRNSAGHLMSEQAFGHTGFTGTSIWIDPTYDTFVILLSNRVDPTRKNMKIGHVRVELADAVMSVIRSANSSSASPRK